MERNWKKWKRARPLERRRLNTIREEDKEDEMGQMRDIINEL